MGSRSRSTYVLSLLALIAAPFIVGCDPNGGTESSYSKLCSGYNPEAGSRPGSFGTSAAAVKLNAVLDTSISLAKSAKEIESDTVGACKAMAKELGIPDAELAVPAGMENQAGIQATTICGRVDTEIKKIIGMLGAEAKLTIIATPAVCTVDASFQHDCVKTCETKTYTETELMCTPGKLSGSCSAMCTGTCKGSCSAGCSGSCSASCTGTCEGQISGKCEGTCNGVCNGTCSAMGADGKCAGTCTGTCNGTCSGKIEGTCTGKCQGSCSATCEGSCTGSCSGSCTGSCSVAFQAPRCDEVQVERMRTECQRSCETRAHAQASCTEPKLEVYFESNAAAQKAEGKKLLAAIKVGFPKIRKVLKRTKGVIDVTAKAYWDSLAGLPAAVGEVGLQAAGCATAAVEATARAVGQINASVSVSVNVHVSATGSANVN